MSAAKRQQTCAACGNALDCDDAGSYLFETLIDDIVRLVCVHPYCTTHPHHRKGLITGPALDGWEDEYGPVPLPVPSYQWYDEVVVLRVLHGGGRVDRDLTPGEKQAIVKRGAHLTNEQIADRTGAKFSTINQWFKRYGEGVRV